MAIAWNNYGVQLILLVQTIICLHLYFSQVALVTKLDHLLENQVEHERGRREVRSVPDERNTLYDGNSSLEVYSTEDVSRPLPNVERRRKTTRLPVEKYFQSTESTTSPPVHVRASRTKSTGWRSRGSNRQHKAMISEFDDRRSIPLQDASMAASALPPAVAHFVGDTSNYSMHRHDHYAGNGRIKVSGIYKDWRPAHWVTKLGSNQHFNLSSGRVSVSRGGLYLLYAQIHYADIKEVNCFRAHHNGSTIAQCCLTSPHTAQSDNNEIKANTCNLLTTVYLRPSDQIWLSDLHERFVILSHEKSFFGLVQLAAV